jgi:hypothetical protein
VIALLLVALAAPARAYPMQLHDLPGTDGRWTEGVAVVNAPPAQVHEWLTDYARWPERFPDMAWTQSLGDDERGRHIVRFRSILANRTFTIHEAVSPNLLVFDGWAPNVHIQGRIWLEDAGDGKTRVVMQSTNEVHGFIGLFATHNYRRRASLAAIATQLRALLDLAAAR